MRLTQRTIVNIPVFALTLLFATYGCQTTNNSMTSEQSVSTRKSEPAKVDVENTEPKMISLSQTTPVEKSTVTTEKPSDSDKEHLEKFQKRFGSLLMGHGAAGNDNPQEKESAVDAPGESDTVEDRPFVELEKKLYGNWINMKETESYGFHDDGTVIVTVIGQRDRRQMLNGHYRLVEEGRIKIDFEGDPFAGHMPPSYFKISFSENEFTLTDEPKGVDQPDGPSTKYQRIK